MSACHLLSCLPFQIQWDVSIPYLLALFCWLVLTFHLWWTASECFMLTYFLWLYSSPHLCLIECKCPFFVFLLLSWPIPPSALGSLWVPLACWISFAILTCACLYAWQLVSAACLLTFFCCPDLSLPLCPIESECPLLCSFCLSFLTYFSIFA
jgi:hypothetical protein